MHLQKLSLVNFKNYAEATLEFTAGCNAFTGFNGSGKTNLLDAIYYLCLCKSYFNPIDSQNILHHQPFFVIQGSFMIGENEEQVYCGLKRNQKKQFKRNQKEYSRLADHIGLFPVVMISPEDSSLITGGSEERRKLTDSIVAQHDKMYLDHIIAYNRALTQRNALLRQFAAAKQFDRAVLEIWDEQLISLAPAIYTQRCAFVEKLTPLFNQFFAFISNGKEAVSISYETQLKDVRMEDLLKNSLEKDKALQYTTVGIHKDDLIFKINNYPVKKFGSQGQQKAFLTALKLAQFSYIYEIKGIKPLLLLDDIFDKLDHERATRLMELVSRGSFGQIFITDTNPDRIKAVFEKINTSVRLFDVKDGHASLQY